jgi:hypothetical protein
MILDSGATQTWMSVKTRNNNKNDDDEIVYAFGSIVKKDLNHYFSKRGHSTASLVFQNTARQCRLSAPIILFCYDKGVKRNEKQCLKVYSAKAPQ